MKNKIGTFRCWLWGHLFIYQANITYRPNYDGFGGQIKEWNNVKTDYCIRCGILKEEIK